jgi:hypothetical protein
MYSLLWDGYEQHRAQEEEMAQSVVTRERFAKGMTFDDYVKYTGTAENLAREAFGSYFADGGSKPAPRKDNSAVFRERYAARV